MGDVADAMRTAFNGLTVHEQAFAQLPDQIKTQAASAATTAVENVSSENVTNVVTAFNSFQGAVIYFPGLGTVQNELGVTAYTTKQGDSGTKLIFGDSTPITVTLNPDVAPPWFCFIGNDSSASVAITTDSGATVRGIQEINFGGLGIVFYDGSVFWSEGVSPDGTTIVADSSTGCLRTNGMSTTIATAKLTTGGTNGSMVFVEGILRSSTPAT
jgi:hypothetical protein